MLRPAALVLAAVAVHWLWLPVWIQICREVIRDIAWYHSMVHAGLFSAIAAAPLVASVLLAAQELRRLTSRLCDPAWAGWWRRNLRAAAVTYGGGLVGLTAIPCVRVRVLAIGHAIMLAGVALAWLLAGRAPVRRGCLTALRVGALASGLLLLGSWGAELAHHGAFFDFVFSFRPLATLLAGSFCILSARELESGARLLPRVRYPEPVSSVP